MAGPSSPKTFVYKTAGTGTFSVPADWNNANNKVEVIGGGGGASVGASRMGGAGGGGGAYAQSNNIILIPGGSAFYQVGNYGAGGRTAQTPGANGTNSWFNTTASAQPTAFGLGNVVAYFGERGNTAASGTVNLGGAGGAATPTTGAGQIANVSFAGGAGANSSIPGTNDVGGGGGGSSGSLYGTGFRGGYSQSAGGGGGGGGGVKGVGGNNSTTTSGAGGANATSIQASASATQLAGNTGVNGGGGSGGGGSTGANETAGRGGDGGVGRDYTDSVTGEVEGAGGGGGGGGGASASTGTSSGGGNANTGGGGGAAGGGRGTSNTISGNGGSGLVVITYLPAFVWAANTATLGNRITTQSQITQYGNTNSTSAQTKVWWANTATLRNQTNTTSYFVNNAGNSSGSKTRAWWANTSTLGNRALASGSAITNPIRFYPNPEDGYIANNSGSEITLSGNVSNPGFVITFPSAYDGYYNDGGSFVGIGGTIDIDNEYYGFTVSAPISFIVNRDAEGGLETDGIAEVAIGREAPNVTGSLITTSQISLNGNTETTFAKVKAWEANTSTLGNKTILTGSAATLKANAYPGFESYKPTGSLSTQSQISRFGNTTSVSAQTKSWWANTRTFGNKTTTSGAAVVYFINEYYPSDWYPALKLSGSAIIGAKSFSVIVADDPNSISGRLNLTGAASQTEYTSGATFRFLYPNTDIQAASWYNSDDTQTNMYDYINEEDAIDSDYIWSNTLNSEYIVKVDTPTRIIRRNGWSINFRAASPDGTNITLTTTFYNGSNVIASWADSLTSSLQFIKHDLTLAQVNSIPATATNLRIGFKIS